MVSQSFTNSVPGGSDGTASVSCGSGEVVTGGGFELSATADAIVYASRPNATATDWITKFHVNTQGVSGTVYVLCGPAGDSGPK